MRNNMKITAKQEQATPVLVPKLRFPEFRGAALRSVLLGDVTEECRARNGHKHLVTSVMGVTKADGIVPMEARLIAADIARYKLVQHDWFAYNPMRLNIGSIARWRGQNEILVSPDYVVFKCLTDSESSIAPGFLDHFRQTKTWEEFVTEGGDGSVRVRIYYKDIARVALVLPPFPEQQKIADCLSSVDELIAAQARKMDALKAHKKGLMQQLFPREGETQPRLRFPEFQNAGEWDFKPFEEFVTKSFYGTSSSTSPTGKYPVLRMGNMVDGGLDFTNMVYLDLDAESFESFRLENGDILLNRTNSPALVGKISLFQLNSECMTASYIVSYRLNKKRIDPSFCNSMLNTPLYQSRIRSFAKPSVSQVNINPTTFKKDLMVSVPSLPEQQRIAECLTSIDDLIAVQTQKLEALRTHKKGLLLQIFPSPEE